MKFLLSLSFLLFAAASSINASSFFAADGPTAPDGPTPPPILDVTGAPLQFGVPYYMKPVKWKWGNGVSLAGATRNQPCPKLIQVIPSRTDWGTPVIFSSAVQNVTGNITIGSKLIINFYNLTRPNDEFCGGSNSTTWVTTITRNLEVGEEERSTVFRLSPSRVAQSYLLKPVSRSKKLDLVVVADESGNLRVILAPRPGEKTKLSFVFGKEKSTEEDEDDKPVIIQMPRKMSVLRL